MPIHNPVKTKLQQNKATCGSWLLGCSALCAETVGLAGLEFVIIDLEHGHGDFQTLLSQLHGLSAYETVPIVRVPMNDSIYIKRVLDMGAYGIMVPLINSAEEAQQAIRSAKYPPEGDRGCAKGVRAYGFGKYFDDYVPTVNQDLLMILQIETKEAVDNIDEIAAVEGIDVLFCGPSDLAVSYGHMGNIDHPSVDEAILKVREAASRRNIPVGILAHTWDRLDRFYNEGFQFLIYGSDLSFVMAGTKELLGTFQKLTQSSPS